MNIYYLMTAALIETPWDDITKAYTKNGLLRKYEYVAGFNAIKKITNEFYVVEAISKSPITDINEHTDKICYVNKEYNIRYQKGQELLLVEKAINFFNFKEEDFIIKLTGRYRIQSDKILKNIDNDCEFIGKIRRSWVSSCMVGMTVKRWKECVLFNLENNTVSKLAVEKQIAYYLRSNKDIKFKRLDTLDLIAINNNAHEECPI